MELGSIHLNHPAHITKIKLNLPILAGLELDYVRGVGRLILDVPRLQNVRIRIFHRCTFLRMLSEHSKDLRVHFSSRFSGGPALGTVRPTA